MEIETFDGERLGRKKMIAVDWVGDEAIIYLKQKDMEKIDTIYPDIIMIEG